MRSITIRSYGLHALAAVAGVVAMLSPAAHAGLVIEFTGMNLVYDGSALYDAGSSAGGFGNPADADALNSVDFVLDGSLIGSLSSDIFLDLYIPDIVGIPSAPNTVFNMNTIGNPGFADLLIGTGPLASQFLTLDIGSVNVTYVDASGFAQFTFAATISSTYGQNLPFGVSFDGPVIVSFSSQINPGSLTTNNGFVTGFTASGTGEFAAVPAPGAAIVLGMGLLAARGRRRRLA